MVRTAEQPDTNHGRGLKASSIVRMLLAIGMPVALLFGVSGRWDWTAGWIYFALLVSGMLAATAVFVRFQPGLATERAEHWRDGARWDRPFLLVIGVIGPPSAQLVCGLDKRFGWSAGVPVEIQAVAAVVSAIGIAITAWAMAVNPFFSATVRIQTERGHIPIDAGPYAVIRHPGYAGMLLVTLGGPILLGTLWGLVPAAAIAAAFAARTALEDRTLIAELPGYAQYADRVRDRLLPGVW